MFLPDCDSFLRNAQDLIVNDDEWLSVRAKYGVSQAGLFLLHPHLLQVGAALGVPAISSVLVEMLDLRYPEDHGRGFGRGSSVGVAGGDVLGDMTVSLQGVAEPVGWRQSVGGVSEVTESSWDPPGSLGEATLIERINTSLRSEEFVLALHALHLNKAIESGRRGEMKGEGNAFEHHEIGERCRDVTLRFINHLPVRLILRDARRTSNSHSSGITYFIAFYTSLFPSFSFSPFFFLLFPSFSFFFLLFPTFSFFPVFLMPFFLCIPFFLHFISFFQMK